MSTDMNAYREGFHRGWENAYSQRGRAAPNAPTFSNPPSVRGADKRTDHERGYEAGLFEALNRLNK